MDADVLFYIAFGVAAAWLLRRAVQNRSVAGTLFGTPVRRKSVEIDAQGQGMYDVALDLYVLDPEDPRQGPHVGIMVSVSSFASLNQTPVGLTRSQARRLADELTRAAEETAG